MKRPPAILIVEDQALVAEDLAMTLQRLGYAVAGIAASGEECAELVGRHRPDLVLMDIIIQGDADGVETAERMRTEFGLPVVYVTSHSDEATFQRAKIHNAFGYIIKPVAERELQMAIEIGLYRQQLDVERDQLVEELRLALAQVKTLSGLLPMCAWCRKVRDDNGYWQQVEQYIVTHSNASVTHGICPSCAKDMNAKCDGQ